MSKRNAHKRRVSDELKAHYIQCEAKHDALIERAGTIDDPAEKLLHFEKIRQELRADWKQEQEKINEAVVEVYPWGRRQKVTKGILFAVSGVGDLVYEGKNMENRSALTKHLQGEARAHLNRMSDREHDVNMLIKAIVNTHLPEITGSPLREDIFNQPALFDKLVDRHVQDIAKSPLGKDLHDEPGLLRKFAEVALRKGIAVEGKGLPAPAAETAVKKPVLRKKVLRMPRDLG